MGATLSLALIALLAAFPGTDALSPRAQHESCVHLEDIRCPGGMVVLESPRGTPACVLEQSAGRLADRGFARVPPAAGAAHAAAPAINEFAMGFYRQVSGGDANVLFSPAGMYASLSLLHGAASGDAAEQVRRSLGLDPGAWMPGDGAVRHAAEAALGNRCVTLDMASALWLDDGPGGRGPYADLADGLYRTDVYETGPEGRGAAGIGAWAGAETGGMIRGVAGHGDAAPGAEAALTSVAYFNGRLKDPLGKLEYELSFRDSAGQRVMPYFMQDVAAKTRPYADLGTFRMVKMPYAGDDLSMLLILPRDAEDMRQLERSISTEKLEAWKGSMADAPTVVAMPEFELGAEYGRQDLLSALGLQGAPHPGAGLPGAASPGKPPHLGTIAQSSLISVSNSTGAVASAAHILAMRVYPEIHPAFRILVNQPFLFMVQDDRTGAILMMGRVMTLPGREG